MDDERPIDLQLRDREDLVILRQALNLQFAVMVAAATSTSMFGPVQRVKDLLRLVETELRHCGVVGRKVRTNPPTTMAEGVTYPITEVIEEVPVLNKEGQ